MYRRKLLERKSMFSSLLHLWKEASGKSHETQDHAKRLQELAIKMGNAIRLPESSMDDLFCLRAS